MGRSNGYRPTKAVREEVLALRAQLSELTIDHWQQASAIMQDITGLLGHPYGPMGGSIQPRVCKYCKHFGHTRQWCKLRLAAVAAHDEREAERMLAEDRALGIGENLPDTEWSRWCQLANDAHRELCAIKLDWSDEEWEREFRKRAGEYDFETRQIKGLYE